MNVKSLTACNSMYEREYRFKILSGFGVCILAAFSTYLSIGMNVFLAVFSLYLMSRISLDGKSTPLESIMAVTYSLIIITSLTLVIYELGSVSTSPILSIPDIRGINHFVLKATTFLFLMNTGILLNDKSDWDTVNGNDYFVDVNTKLLNLHLSFTNILASALILGIFVSFSGHSDIVMSVLSPILLLSCLYAGALYLMNGRMGIDSKYMLCLMAIVALIFAGDVLMYMESTHEMCFPASNSLTVTFYRFIDVASLFIYAMLNSYICLLFSALYPHTNVFISVGQTPVKRDGNEWNYF